MTSRMGLESLSQRGRSDLYKSLVSMAERASEALSGLNNPKARDVNMHLKSFGFLEELKDLAMKHMGIHISKVIINESSYPNAYAMIAINDRSWNDFTKSKSTVGMFTEILGRVYDDRTGKLNLDRKEYPYIFTMGITTAWWTIRDASGKPFFNAGEIAAIILHELGHYDHWIRTIFKAQTRILDASDLIDYIQTNASVADIKQVVEKVKKSKYINSSWKHVLKAVDEYFSKAPDSSDPYYVEAINSLCVMIEYQLSSATLVNTQLYMESPTNKSGSSLFEIDAERSADEFSSRNGAYADLTSALAKMNDLRGPKSDLLLRQYMWAGPAAVFQTLNMFFERICTSAEDIAFGYDPMIKRLGLIVETAKHAYADSTLPAEVKLDIKNQIAMCETYLDSYANSEHRQFRLKLKDWLERVGKTGSILKAPFYNRKYADYTKLQDATRSLSRHPLYYLANK